MPLSGASEALVRRWLDRPENRAEWERLRTALSLAEGFQFFALQVSDPIGELFLEMLLRAEAGDMGVELTGFDLARPPESGPVLSVLLHTLEGAPRPSWFYVQGNTFFRESGPAVGDFFLYLNQKRDVVAQAGGAPFLLVLPSEGWLLFRQAAPDFWSIHTSVYRFGSAEFRREERVREASEEAYLWQTFASFVAVRFLRAVLPPPARRQHARGLPPPARGGLPGREAEKRTLRTWLAQPGSRIAVQGFTGAGKTSLLQEAMASATRTYLDGIFYFSLADDDVTEIMEDVVEALRPGLLVPLLRRDVLKAMFRDVTAEKKVLLVLDDANDPEALADLVPSPPSAVVATLRNSPSPEGWRRLVLGAPSRGSQTDDVSPSPPERSPGEAARERNAGPVTAEAVSQDALTLVQKGNLDGARERLAAARALARESGRTDLEALVVRHQAALALWTGSTDEAAGLGEEVVRLKPEGRVRGDLLSLALLAAVSLGEELQVQELIPLAGEAESTVSPALRLLVGCTAIARFAGDSELAKIQGDLEVALDVAADPAQDPGVQAWLLALRGELQLRQKDLAAARESVGLALRQARDAYDWEAEAEVLRVLGHIQEWAGDFIGAEASFRRLLDLREKLYSRDHEGVAWAALELARLQRRAGRLKEAEHLHLRAVAIFQRGRPGTNRALAAALHSQGRLLLDMARFSEAETILREALAAALSSVGPAHPYSASILGLLATLALETGRSAEAEDLLRSSLAIQERSQAPRSPIDQRLLAATLSLLVEALAERDQVSDALVVLQGKVLPILDVLGDLPGRARALGQIARLLASQKRYDEALPFFQERLSLFENLGDVRSRAVALGEIADLLAFQKRYSEALPLFREQMALLEKLGDAPAAEKVRKILQDHELEP